MVDNPATRVPAGATEISAERFEELMAAQQGGAQIVLSRGKPIAVPRALSPEEHRAARRRRRDQLLAASDWTQLPDSPLTEGEKADWADYRTALRNLDMDGEDWPLAPDGEEEE
ncbi:MAG: phage tail protein [Erythrobacter sp.]|nr:phage tail protein [Erythrobacter sp.]